MIVFRKLTNKRGSIIFITVLFSVILLMGTSTLFLVAQVHEDKSDTRASVFSRYSYESYGKIMANELLTDLSEVTASVYYSPILTSEETLGKLQSSLHEQFLDSAGHWKYDNLLPLEVTSAKINSVVSISEFPTVVTAEDLKTDQAIPLSDVVGTVQFSTLDYSFSITGVKLNCAFISNKVVCSFDVSEASITKEHITLR